MKRLLLLLAACSGGSDGLGSPQGAGGVADASHDMVSPPTPPEDGSALDVVKADAPDDAGCNAPPDVPKCDEAWATPPQNLSGWSKVFSNTGMLTLTHDVGHVHDDTRGPLGFCPAKAKCGEKYLALVSARFETDQQDKNFPDSAHCVVDYTQPDPMMMKYGMCYSAGTHHIYVEVRDEKGTRITQGEGVAVTSGGMTTQLPDGNKPPNEFPINVPMYGGGLRYMVRATYMQLPSDAVTNMRMPINHHVSYLLTFQIKTR